MIKLLNLIPKQLNHTCDKSLKFLVVACPDYHFVELDWLIVNF